MKKLDRHALELIKDFESFVPYPYDDLVPAKGGKYPEYKGGPVKGTITQGYGHTNAAGPPKIKFGSRWTKEYAEQILEQDLQKVIDSCDRLIKTGLNAHQYGAIVSFQYNTGSLGKSSVLRLVNAEKFDDVPEALMKYVMSKGKKLKGLERRRKAECELWQSRPCETTKT
jgi:lysozyme